MGATNMAPTHHITIVIIFATSMTIAGDEKSNGMPPEWVELHFDGVSVK